MKGLFKKSIKSLRRPDKSQVKNPTESNNQLRRDEYTGQLEDASIELNKTLQEYFEKRVDKPTNTTKQLYTQMTDPEKLASLIHNVILNEVDQKKGHSRKVSDAFGKIYPFATLVLKFGAAAGEAFQPVKALMVGLDLLLQVTEGERTVTGNFVDNLENIAYQCARVTELQKSISDKQEWNPLVIQKSAQLLTVIIQYFNVSIRFFCQGVWQSMGQSVFQGQQRYSGILENLKIAISEYDQALLLQIAVTTLSTKVEIRDRAIRAASSEVLKWLNSAYWETEAQFASLCNNRTEDSFQWILNLEAFKQWRNQNRTSLWLKATPGFGKSTLAAYLIQLLLPEAHALVLFFFCRNTNPNLRTLQCLIRTLAAQILKKIPESQDYFYRLRNQGFECTDPSLLFDKFIREPLAKFSGKVYIVVDGLDELLEDSFMGMRDNSIGDACTMLQKVSGQLILTSRPTPYSTSKHGNFLHHRLTTENSNDIRTYVARRISTSLFLQNGFNGLNDGPEMLLAEKAQGNFLWVVTLLRLLDKPSLSIKQFQALLADVPEPLNQVYVEVLDRLDQNGSLELVMIVLRCVLFSVSPLTVEMLQAAVSKIHGEIISFREFIESECGSILAIIPGDEDGRGDIVQVTHETFRSFITSSDAAGDRKLFASHCHRYLAVACLECLLMPDKNDSLHEYALKNWFAHFQRQAQDNTPDDFTCKLLECVHGLCTKQDIFCAWLRDLTFLIQNESRMRFFCFELVEIHESIQRWLFDLDLDHLTSASLKEGSSSIINRKNQLIGDKNSDLAQYICKCFARTWLRTNWKTPSLSHWVFLQAKKTAQILLWDEDSSSNGKIRSISHTDFSSTTTQHVQSLGDLGGFSPFVGVQAGNYAFGCLAAKDPSCAQYLRSALDEHPDWWHFHESLGDWYYRKNSKRQAVEAFAMAMKHDPTSPPSATYMYWTTRCDICLEEDDPTGAVETLLQAVQMFSTDSTYASRYWDRMASIWRDRERWEELKIIYTDALRKRSICRDDYWIGLAEAYEKLRDWKGLLKVLLSALKDDPDNSRRYANRICRFVMELNECMLFDHSIEVLCSAIEGNASNKRQYLVLLASTYMAGRKWDKAVEIYQLLDDENECIIDKDFNLGHAHLAMGHLNEARSAFEKSNSTQQKEAPRLPDILALGYMIDGNIPEAIRILKRCISYAYTQNPTGAADTIQAGMLMDMHLNLGQCYQATDRDEDARLAYDSGISALQSLKNEILNKLPSSDDEESPLWRCDARVLMIYGELLERVGKTIEAGQQYEAAQRIMTKTLFVEDDDILQWEYENCLLACERVKNSITLSNVEIALKRNILESRICCLYRLEWYSFMKSETPRFRGGDNGWSAKILT